jgi:predicted RNA-binding protein YlqC (UPF0109 family)
MPLKALVTAVAGELVDDPAQVSVTEIAGDQDTLFELRVAKTDLGKVIGREGRTAQAMRSVLSAAAAKLGKRAHLEIID